MKHRPEPLSSETYRDLLTRFMQGWTVAMIHKRHPLVRFAALADAYFAVQAELRQEYSQRLSGALTRAAMSRGISRATVAQRALETLAALGLVDQAVSGRLMGRKLKLAAEEGAIPKFIERRT